MENDNKKHETKRRNMTTLSNISDNIFFTKFTGNHFLYIFYKKKSKIRIRNGIPCIQSPYFRYGFVYAWLNCWNSEILCRIDRKSVAFLQSVWANVFYSRFSVSFLCHRYRIWTAINEKFWTEILDKGTLENYA